MKQNLHIVFPKEYMATLIQGLSEYQQINVTGTDYDLDGFYHYALKDGEVECNVAVVVIDIKGDIPIEKKAEEILEKLTEIRINRPHLRLILSLSKSYEHMTFLKQRLVSLSIYDIHFQDEFGIPQLIEWIKEPKSLADMKDYLSASKHTINDSSLEIGKVSNSEIAQNNNKTDTKNRASRLARKNDKKNQTVKVETKVITETVSITQKNIAFVSISRNSGSTFHAINFASFLSEGGANVGLYENFVDTVGRTYLSDYFEIYTENSNLVSVPHEIARDGNGQFENEAFKYKNMNVYAVDYQKGPIEEMSEMAEWKYLNSGRHLFKVVDLGYVPFQGAKDFKLYDHVIVIVDLDPLKFIPNTERLMQLLDISSTHKGTKFDFWINSFSRTYPIDELQEIGLHKNTRIPTYDRDEILEAIYKRETVYNSSNEIKASLEDIYTSYCVKNNISLPKTVVKKKKFFEKMLSF